jgi:hypothetical protein
MIKKIPLCLLFLCLSCAKEHKKPNDQSPNIYQLHYFKDQRTDLCFAFSWAENNDVDVVRALGSSSSYDSGPILTNVPCRMEVEALLEEPPKYFRYIK